MKRKLSVPESDRVKQAVLALIDFGSWHDPHAVTPTFRQCLWLPEGKVWLDEIFASRNVRHYLNVVSRKMLPLSAFRRGQRVHSAAVLEGTNTKRLHYHLMVDRPVGIDRESFRNALEAAWPRTHWGHREVLVEPCDSGWLRYMLKSRDKPCYASAFDPTVLNLPPKTN